MTQLPLHSPRCETFISAVENIRDYNAPMGDDWLEITIYQIQVAANDYIRDQLAACTCGVVAVLDETPAHTTYGFLVPAFALPKVEAWLSDFPTLSSGHVPSSECETCTSAVDIVVKLARTELESHNV